MRALPLTLLLVAVAAQAADSDSPYAGWCARSASVEQVPAAEQEAHVARCIESLEEADRNPDKGKKKDEEG
ncbi:hypothetical protein [Endothiovibrio diazotrophicus]